MSKKPVGLFLLSIVLCIVTTAQVQDSVLTQASLQQCVQYALAHQPTIKQSLIDEEIVETYIKTKLADWYPQINFDYSIQHYFEVQKSVFNGSAVNLGAKNYSAANFSLNQTIFNPDVLLAHNTKSDVRAEVRQLTSNNKIYTVLNVSKAFYDVLLTQQQTVLTDEDIIRLDRSVKDAFNQYNAGIVDKTDYKRAQISLNNARAQKKQYEELLTSKYAFLKLLMGYPQQSPLDLVYDSVQLQNEIYLDTLQQVNYASRVEYQLLQTQRSLLEANLKYYKWNYLPSVSATGAHVPGGYCDSSAMSRCR
jgi:outer membrane protein TolC